MAAKPKTMMYLQGLGLAAVLGCFAGLYLLSGTEQSAANQSSADQSKLQNNESGSDDEKAKNKGGDRAERVRWTSSRITGTPDPPPPYQVQRLYPELQFKQPVDIVAQPDSDRMFVAEVNGKIFSFDASDSNASEPDLVINLKDHFDDVSQLLGFTLHPEFTTNRLMYVCFAGKAGKPGGTLLVSFKVTDANPPIIDPDSATEIIRWLSGGHNGCCLKFGPDGYLYFSTGDATAPSPPDTLDTGQNLTDLLSCILRIDVDRTSARGNYAIPPDNPFVDVGDAMPEIWAYGFRNPWRMSFDSSGRLWVGDVGWELWEMIYRVQRGGNYGWSVMEGPQRARENASRGPTEIIPPVVSHHHIESRSITGGYVYTGDQLKQLAGHYIYGDYETGIIWSFLPVDGKATARRELARTPLKIITFGLTHEDELLIVDYGGGIYRLVENKDAAANSNFPGKLSQTGLFSDTAAHVAAPGVHSYQINASAWHDHATAQRMVALPGDSQLNVESFQNVRQKFQWRYPQDAVLVKTLSIRMDVDDPKSERRIETQVLQFTGTGNNACNAYTYRWNREQTDAVLVASGGEDMPLETADANAHGGIRKQTWRFAARNECLVCHNDSIGGAIAFNTPQLIAGDSDPTQLDQLISAGLFTKPVDSIAPSLVDPYDEQHDLESRAKSWLHVNCTFCHRFQGGGNAKIELRHDFETDKMNLVDERPMQGIFGIDGAKLIAPGDSSRSVLLLRLAKTGPGRMPRAGADLTDVRGLNLLSDWITSMDAKADADNANQKDEIQTAVDFLSSVLATDSETGEPLSAGQAAAVDSLLQNPRAALLISLTIDDLPVSHPIRQAITDKAMSRDDASVRELFERLVPPEKRIARLGESVDSQAILKLAGDSSRGAKLFFENAGVQCKNCHSTGTSDQRDLSKLTLLGPDLADVSKKQTREQILESILTPSSKVDPKFATHLCETTDGKSHSGILLRRDDHKTVLLDADHKQIEIENDKIEFFEPQSKSMMPELLVRDLSAQDVADLIALIQSTTEADSKQE